MKKIITIFLCLMCAFSFGACIGNAEDEKLNEATTTYNFSVNKNEIILEAKDTFQILATYGREEVSYSVKDSSIATVTDSGLVTAISEGVTYVTISAGGVNRTCKVNVVKYEYEVRLNIPETVNMTVGTVLSLSAKLYRNDKQYDGSVSWSATGGTITPDGANAIFTATEKGVYTVTSSSEKGAIATCIITVGEVLGDF